jgi:hypothetical protein
MGSRQPCGPLFAEHCCASLKFVSRGVERMACPSLTAAKYRGFIEASCRQSSESPLAIADYGNESCPPTWCAGGAEGMTVSGGRCAIRDLLEFIPCAVAVRRAGSGSEVDADTLACPK